MTDQRSHVPPRTPLRQTLAAIAFATAVTLPLSPAVAQPATSTPPIEWPDRPLTNWNQLGGPIPPPATPAPAALATRCPPVQAVTSAAAAALSGAGWLPFLYFDRELVAGDVEVLGGMTGADPICRPMGYNLFVFVGGRFAGTLSPRPMDARADLSSGMVRLLPDEALAVEITRYGPNDPPCCPSARDTVRFAVDRSRQAPVVGPVEARRTRGGK